jgi:hypothetical protein
MKRKLLIFFSTFIIFQFGLSLSCFFPHYEIQKERVIYIGGRGTVVLKNVDIKTFKELDIIFGIDENRVYYEGKHLKNIDAGTFEIVKEYIPIPDDPVWGIGCKTPYIEEFKDKNGIYKLEDIRNGKLELEE